jgi:prepilin-type N-terminal cleavage/methylation domain-containing protein
MKKGFTLVELLVVITIIGILSNIGISTFSSAQQKTRDAKRKAYLKQIADAFEAYHNDKGQYPADNGSGNPLACGDDAQNLCSWGSSTVQNATTGTIYMVKLPTDPTAGLSFYYDAIPAAGLNSKFQLYARLENTKDPDVPKDGNNNPLVYSGLNCGAKLCNYGISSSNISPTAGRTLTTE